MNEQSLGSAPVRFAAERARAEFQRHPLVAIENLVHLAERFATTRELVHDAIMLRRELASANGVVSDQIVERANALIDRIELQSNSDNFDVELAQVQASASRIQEEAFQIPVRKDVVVSTTKLAKSYGSDLFSLQDVSIELRFGQITGVVGRNGGGKTSLFRLLTGELRPDSGSVQFPGMMTSKSKVAWDVVRDQIAYVPQELPRWFGSLRANLHYEAAIHGIRGKENISEIDFIIERFGLGNELQKSWQELSGGYKLRFSLARALVWKPKLLILDEPLANLDFQTQQVVLKDLRHLANSLKYPIATIVSSQHLHEIEEISDTILFLKRGKVVYYGELAGIGANRDRNTFELSGNMDLAQLRASLSGSEYKLIYHSGASYVVITELTITADKLLERLFSDGVPIDYFRDISHSAKSLFEDVPA